MEARLISHPSGLNIGLFPPQIEPPLQPSI